MGQTDAEILWDVARVLARDAVPVSRGEGPAHPNPPLLFFTDPVRTPRPWETAAHLPAGSGVVLRLYGRPNARETALRLREITRARDVRLLIGLDADLADAVGADGVHLPERALDEAAGVRAARPDWWISGAAHAAAAFEAPGLDALIVSPVFPAGGASGDRPALGMAVFRTLVATAPCPVYALGGINAVNAPDLVGSGACGLAGVGAVQAAFGPA